MNYSKKIIGFSILLILFILSPSSVNAYCGDKVLESAYEECDDGNYTDRDGCDSYCKLEDMTPPTVVSVSIANQAVGVNALIKNIIVVFSEGIDSTSINKYNVAIDQAGISLETISTLASDKKTVTIELKQDLLSEVTYAIRIKNIKDLAGNIIKGENNGYYISTFTTGKIKDTTPPTVLVKPPGGTYNASQSVELIPYKTSYTNTDHADYIDSTAKIYYTVDDVNLSEKSSVFSSDIKITETSVLRFFAVDSVGNKSATITQTYKLQCPEYKNAKEIVDKYPTCSIVKCNYGYVLSSGFCVQNTSNDSEDYKTNAITAPLLGSSTPMYVTTRPAIYITLEHRGTIKRPIVFQDPKRGTIIEFAQNTEIIDKDNKLFSGYIKHPTNLYMKDFPTNFGYIFRSIFEFKAADGRDLTFTPAYKITVPYTDSFESSEGVTIFQYDDKTEKYTEYDKKLYTTDLIEKKVTITSSKTGRFFIAQVGSGYNEAIFKDTINHWAKNYIEALYKKGIVQGKSKGVFSPDENLTRAEFVKIALKSIGAEIESLDKIQDAPFKDVLLDSWYIPYVKKAKDLGLIKGYVGNTFKPDQIINRAEAVKILFAAFKFDLSKYQDTKPKEFFIDIKQGEWYYPYANFAIQNGIMNGIPGTSSVSNESVRLFGPSNPTTRAEMAKLAIKAMELQEKLKKTP